MSFNHHIHKIYSGINDSYTGAGRIKDFILDCDKRKPEFTLLG